MTTNPIPNSLKSGKVSIKDVFHKDGKTLLRRLAKHLGLPTGTYQVRSNRAGDAIFGEVTLHTGSFYVQLSVDGFPDTHGTESHPVRVLYRSCEGLKDYTGGANQWTTLQRIEADPEAFVEALRRLG